MNDLIRDAFESADIGIGEIRQHVFTLAEQLAAELKLAKPSFGNVATLCGAMSALQDIAYSLIDHDDDFDDDSEGEMETENPASTAGAN